MLEDYQKASGDQFRFTVSIGRLHREDLACVLSMAEINEGSFFIVGPNPAVLANQRLLRRVGVSARRIHQERPTM
ncbi:hypothetical protein [Nonomuraea angiospora]